MKPQSSRNGVALQRPTPTPETQELYNRMRREEERLTPESLSQVPAWEHGFSDPLSPSRPMASPASLSYDTVSQATADTGVSDPPGATKPRPGRKGPLPQAKKQRAALLRKLRACNKCRGRRVKCAHFDFSLFEDAYQATKQQRTHLVDAEPHNTPAPSQLPRFGDAADLLGVGLGQSRPLGSACALVPFSDSAWDEISPPDATDMDMGPLRNPQQHQAQLPSLVFSTFDEPEEEEPHLLFPTFPTSRSVPDMPLSRQTAETLPPSRSAASLPSLRLLAAAAGQHRPTSVQPADTLPPPPPSPRNNTIALGKQLSPGSDWWICLWQPPSPSPSSSSFSPWHAVQQQQPSCNGHFRGWEALKTHFALAHAAFYRDWHLWKCVECALELSKPPDPGRPCPRCGRVGPLGWSAWCYGQV